VFPLLPQSARVSPDRQVLPSQQPEQLPPTTQSHVPLTVQSWPEPHTVQAPPPVPQWLSLLELWQVPPSQHTVQQLPL
jgi:hypothetical protein